MFPVHLFQVCFVHPAFQVSLGTSGVSGAFISGSLGTSGVSVRLFQVHSVHPVFQVRLSQVRSVHLAFLPESDNLYFHL